MIGWLRPRVRNQPIIALYFESENVLKFYNLEAWFKSDEHLHKLTTVVRTIVILVQIQWSCNLEVILKELLSFAKLRLIS